MPKKFLRHTKINYYIHSYKICNMVKIGWHFDIYWIEKAV